MTLTPAAWWCWTVGDHRAKTPFGQGERTSGKHEEIVRRTRGVLVFVKRVVNDIGRVLDEKYRETTNETTDDEWTASEEAGRTCTARLQSALCDLRAPVGAGDPTVCIFFEGRRRGWVRQRGPAADRYGRRSNVSHESRGGGYRL